MSTCTISRAAMDQMMTLTSLARVRFFIWEVSRRMITQARNRLRKMRMP